MIWKLNLFPGSQPAVTRKHGHGHRIIPCSFPQPAPTLKKGIRRTESLIFTRSPRPAVRPCAARPFRPSSRIHLLPDGRYLLTIRHDNYKDTRKKSYEVFDELPFWGNGQGYTNAKRNRYAVYDLKSGDLTYVDDEWTDCSQYSVFGNLLLYKAYPWKQSVMGIRPGVYLYDLATGEKVTLIDPDSMRTGVVSLLDEKNCDHRGNR